MWRSTMAHRRSEAVAGWFRGSPATRIGGPAAAVLLGVSGLFGGLDHVPLAERVDAVKSGTEVTVQPFALTWKRAVAVDEIAGVARPLTAGHHLMVVLLDARNLSARSVRSLLLLPLSRANSFRDRNVVVLDDRLAPSTATLYDADTDAVVNVLSPGLTYRLAIVWEFGGAVPDRLPLGLAELTLRGGSVSPDVLEWEDPDEAATVTLPVVDGTAERA
jgi:hypothetical protein